jgi:hypothetical protein
MLTVPLFAITTRSLIGKLVYRRDRLRMKQARLIGRYALVPMVHVDEYVCRAEIDWIQMRFQLARRTQHQWLQQALKPVVGRNSHIDVVDEGPGRSSDEFRVTFQEPDLQRIQVATSRIGEEFGLVAQPEVNGIEISIDFRSRFQDRRDRALLFMALTRHLHATRDVISDKRDRPRFSYGEGQTVGVLGRSVASPDMDDHFFKSLGSDRVPVIDATYYVGSKESDVRWRVMDKIIDTQNPNEGTFVALDDVDKRVRIEVTLTTKPIADLGIKTLQDLASYPFSRLQAQFFTFMLPTFSDASQMPASVRAGGTAWRERRRELKFLKTGVIGLAAMDAALTRQENDLRHHAKADLRRKGATMAPRSRTATGPSGTFLAYEPLNDRVGVALRNLGKRVTASLSGS